MADEKIIVSRIQHRRGLKQDLPQPLRPGEVGLAVDSRQVYIGGDPTSPNSVDFNAVSYFEATASAKDHAVSIANNNIIAFQVPFIKYKRGEFNGINKEKTWFPEDARSTINPSKAGATYSSSNYPVFSTAITEVKDYKIKANVTGSATVTVYQDSQSNSHSDIHGNIRIGDFLTGDDITNTPIQYQVTGVTTDPAGGYIVTVNNLLNATANSNIQFIPRNIVNFNTGKTFKNDEVIVKKNGIQLVPEANIQVIDSPSATADFAFDASRELPGFAASDDIPVKIDPSKLNPSWQDQGYHVLTLRTPPSETDEVTLCYYSNANVIQSFEGINGKISAESDIVSFYEAYDIPWYRQIKHPNVRLSTETGLGYIALEHKHISCVADGANVSTPTSLSLGNLMVSRSDIQNPTSTVVVDISDTTAPVMTIVLSQTTSNVYSPIGDGGTYRYNRLRTVYPTNVNSYMHKHLFDVIVSDGSTANINVAIPTPDFSVFREANAELASEGTYAGNDFTNGAGSQTVIKITPENGDVDGIRINDWVRMITRTGETAHELNDVVFKVLHVNQNTQSFNVKVDSNFIHTSNSTPTFTANILNSLAFVNHGWDQSMANTHIQLHSPEHELTTGGSGNIQIAVDDIGTPGGPWSIAPVGYPIDTGNITANAFIVEFVTGNMPGSGTMDEMSGKFMPELDSTYTDVFVTPVLSIDLSSASTLTAATGIVNQPTVSIPAVSSSDVSIFPSMEFLPQDNESRNAVYITQRPGYSSITSGGLEFVLYEDKVKQTLEKLGLTAGEYTRKNNTVKAKLEKWMNTLVSSRDCQLFTNVFTGGTPYAEYPYTDDNPSSLYYGKIVPQSDLGDYNLEIDTTYGEVFFGSREEASNYNYLTNNIYANSTYDRSEDDKDGTRGIINLKNNLEIQTREAASFGEKIESYESLESISILQTATSSSDILTFDTTVYNTFVIEYSIVESSGAVNRYLRTGTMHLSARPDFTADPTNAVILSDRFSSTWEVTHSDPIVEPKFDAILDGNTIRIRLENQFANPSNPTVGDTTVFSIGSNLKMKYIVKRWSSTA